MKKTSKFVFVLISVICKDTGLDTTMFDDAVVLHYVEWQKVVKECSWKDFWMEMHFKRKNTYEASIMRIHILWNLEDMKISDLQNQLFFCRTNFTILPTFYLIQINILKA